MLTHAATLLNQYISARARLKLGRSPGRAQGYAGLTSCDAARTEKNVKFPCLTLRCRLITYWPARSIFIPGAHSRRASPVKTLRPIFKFYIQQDCGAAAAAPRATRAGLPLRSSGPDHNVWQKLPGCRAARLFYCLCVSL